MILVTADVIGLYPSIPHEAGLNTLAQALDNRENKQLPTDNLLNLAKYVWQTITLNLMVKLKNSCYVHLLKPSLHQCRPVFLCINLRADWQCFLCLGSW